MQTVALARRAMATRFELVLRGGDPVSLRAAGEEALDEIERVEAQLSLYCPTSEIAHLNARAARQPVRVTPTLFSLLQCAIRLSRETGGAFDITIAPLVRCWGFMGQGGRVPDADELNAARSRVGMELIQLDPENFTVRFAREGVMLDLGAIGKGYAVERAAELLREAGVTSALLHGGTSMVYALGKPPEAQCWKVAIENPDSARRSEISAGQEARRSQSPPTVKAPERERRSEDLLATVELRDESLSVSAVWGKAFQAGETVYGHVLDPRTGEPARGALLAAVALPSATEADALSTALLVSGSVGHKKFAGLRSGMRTLVIERETRGELKIQARGISMVETI